MLEISTNVTPSSQKSWLFAGETSIENAFASPSDRPVDAVHVTGGFDYQIRVRTRTIGELDQLLQGFKERLGVRETSTRVVLHTVDGFPREPAV